LWLRQADCEEEVHGEVIQFDPGLLYGTGALIGITCLDIEVLHQGNASEERLASLSLRKEFGDEFV
jgi:hypothetical protein